MLSDILFGAVYRKKVLAQLFLHPDTDYHVRELARQTGTAPGTLHKELARLAAAGLLLRTTQGNQVRYQANPHCPVFAELAGLLRKTTGPAELLTLALAPLEPPLAFIYGSWAAGAETATSGIDVVVVGGMALDDVVHAAQPVQAALGREVIPTVLPAPELQRRLQEQDPGAMEMLYSARIFLFGTEQALGELAGPSQQPAES